MGSYISKLFNGHCEECPVEMQADRVMGKLQTLLTHMKSYHRWRVHYGRKIGEEIRKYQDIAFSMFSDIELFEGKYDLEDSMHHENSQAKRNLAEADTVQESDKRENTKESDNQEACHEKNADEYKSKVGVVEMQVEADDDKEQSIKDNDGNEHPETEVKVKEEKGIDEQQSWIVLKMISKMFSEEWLRLKALHNKFENNTAMLFFILMDIEVIVGKLSTKKYDMNNIFVASYKILTKFCSIDHSGCFYDKIRGNICTVIKELLPSPLLYTTYEYDSDTDYSTDTDSFTDTDTDSDFDSDIDITIRVNSDHVLTAIEILRKTLSSYLKLYDAVFLAVDFVSTGKECRKNLDREIVEIPLMISPFQ